MKLTTIFPEMTQEFFFNSSIFPFHVVIIQHLFKYMACQLEKENHIELSLQSLCQMYYFLDSELFQI